VQDGLILTPARRPSEMRASSSQEIDVPVHKIARSAEKLASVSRNALATLTPSTSTSRTTAAAAVSDSERCRWRTAVATTTFPHFVLW
jgi:hypothetical protein